MFDGKSNAGSGFGSPRMAEGFGWVGQLDRLADGDITKHEQVLEQNYRACLNLLLYWFERDSYQEKMLKYNK